MKIKLLLCLCFLFSISSVAQAERILLNDVPYHLGDTSNAKWDSCAPVSPASTNPVFVFEGTCQELRTYSFHIWANGTSQGEIYLDGVLVDYIVAVGVCPTQETIHMLDITPGLHELELRPGQIDSGTEDDDFIFDLIEFDRLECVVANETISWGSLKGIYR